MPHKLCRSRFSGEKISNILTPDILIWYIMKCEVQLLNFIVVCTSPCQVLYNFESFRKSINLLTSTENTRSPSRRKTIMTSLLCDASNVLVSGKDNSVVIMR